MLKDKRHRVEICNPLLWLSHWMVYDFGSGGTESLSLSTMDYEATFAQLPPSMIREKTLPPMVHLVWKMDSLCSNSSWEARSLKALRITKSSPSSGPSSTSSKDSFKYNSFSPFVLSLKLLKWSLKFSQGNNPLVWALGCNVS